MGPGKRLVTLVPFILLLSWAGCAARRGYAGERFLEEKDFPLSAERSLSWNGTWVIETEAGFQVLDLRAASMHPLQLPGLDSLFALADAPGDSAWALGKAGGRLKLMRGRGTSFEEQPLPEGLSAPDNCLGWGLVAEGHTLVLADRYRGEFRVLQGGAWRTPPFAAPNFPEWSLLFARLLLRGSTLYVGFNAGEWGGGLYSLSLESGELKSLCPEEEQPITGLASAPDDRIWVAAGSFPLPFRGAHLWRLDEKGCTLVTDSERVNPGESPWNLEATSFDGLALDSHGEPHLLALKTGVVRRQGQGWAPETLDWRTGTSDFGYQAGNGIVPFYVHDLAVEGETALISTNEGLLLWKLGTREPQLVRVPGSQKPRSHH